MPHFASLVASRHLAFTAAELDAAATRMPAGWALDRTACACAPAQAGRGWEAVLALVGPEGRVLKCASAVHASAGEARADALASVADAVRMIEALEHRADGRRQTALVVDRPEPPTLRPSQIVSLCGEANPRAERR